MPIVIDPFTGHSFSVPTPAVPALAITSRVTVADETARFALTTAEVQNGDYVFQGDTGVLYEVTDENNLYYGAGWTALATLDWNQLTGTPSYVDAGDAAVQGNLNNHIGDANNPHSVVKFQVGLGSADDTSDADKPVSTAQQTALDLKRDLTSVVPVATGGTGLTSLPKFSAQAAASTTTLVSGVLTKAEFTVERYDVGNNYDTTNKRFIAPVTGYYHFDVGVRFQSAITGNYLAVFLYVNGVRVRDFGQVVSDGNPVATGGSSLVAMNVSDYAEVYIQTSFSSGTKMEPGQYSHFGGYQIP